MPFSRGNTRERVEQVDRQAARGQGPQPDPAGLEQPAAAAIAITVQPAVVLIDVRVPESRCEAAAERLLGGDRISEGGVLSGARILLVADRVENVARGHSDRGRGADGRDVRNARDVG